MSKLFFLHIPKAGGTTFYEIIYRNFAYRSVAKIDGTHVAKSIEELTGRPLSVKNKFECIVGHFNYGFHEHFSGKYSYITFLRSPVDRVVSLFHHIKNVPQHPLHEIVVSKGMDIHSFAVSDITREIDNDQVRRISGAERTDLKEADLTQAIDNMEQCFSFVGISEEYDRSLVALNRQFPDWDIRYVPKNVGTRESISSQQAYVETLGNIERRNYLDTQLYQYARARFEAVLQNFRNQLDDDVARLRSQNAKLLQYELRLALPLRFGRRLRNKLRSVGWSPY